MGCIWGTSGQRLGGRARGLRCQERRHPGGRPGGRRIPGLGAQEVSGFQIGVGWCGAHRVTQEGRVGAGSGTQDASKLGSRWNSGGLRGGVCVAGGTLGVLRGGWRDSSHQGILFGETEATVGAELAPERAGTPDLCPPRCPHPSQQAGVQKESRAGGCLEEAAQMLSMLGRC